MYIFNELFYYSIFWLFECPEICLFSELKIETPIASSKKKSEILGLLFFSLGGDVQFGVFCPDLDTALGWVGEGRAWHSSPAEAALSQGAQKPQAAIVSFHCLLFPVCSLMCFFLLLLFVLFFTKRTDKIRARHQRVILRFLSLTRRFESDPEEEVCSGLGLCAWPGGATCLAIAIAESWATPPGKGQNSERGERKVCLV